MGVRGPGHGQGTDIVGQAIIGFIDDGLAIRLLFHAAIETAALDHEVVDDAMKNGAIVKTTARIVQEVC